MFSIILSEVPEYLQQKPRRWCSILQQVCLALSPTAGKTPSPNPGQRLNWITTAEPDTSKFHADGVMDLNDTRWDVPAGFFCVLPPRPASI